MRIKFSFPIQAHKTQGLKGFFHNLLLRRVQDFQGEGHIFKSGSPGEKFEVLEDHSQASPKVRNFTGLQADYINPVYPDFAFNGTLCRIEKFQERRFSCSIRTQQIDKLAFFHPQGDIKERISPGLVSLADMDHFNNCKGSRFVPDPFAPYRFEAMGRSRRPTPFSWATRPFQSLQSTEN